MSGTNVTVTTGGVRVATIAAGPAGKPGSTILSGAGAPDNADGADGDFYVDLTGQRFYGSKTAGAWGSSFSVIGPKGDTGNTGATGAAGRTVLTVSAAPRDDLDGVDGDYAINPTLLVFYGPKSGGTWPAGTSLSEGPTRRVTVSGTTHTVRQADAPGGRDVIYDCTNVAGCVFTVLANVDEPLIVGTIFGFLARTTGQASIVFAGAVDVIEQNGNKTAGLASQMTLTVLAADTYSIAGDTTP